MTKYLLLKQLISLVDEYEPDSLHQGGNQLVSFLKWANARQSLFDQQVSTQGVDGKNFELIGAMEQYAGKYSRELFSDTSLSSIWDFGFLAMVNQDGTRSMSELIDSSKMEKSSGMEVIKRLIKNKLVVTTAHAGDKRKKAIEITKAGRNLLVSLYPKVADLAKQINGNLTSQEKATLHELLTKLDEYHSRAFGYQGINTPTS